MRVERPGNARFSVSEAASELPKRQAPKSWARTWSRTSRNWLDFCSLFLAGKKKKLKARTPTDKTIPQNGVCQMSG